MAETTGNMAISFGSANEHRACDSVIDELRTGAQRLLKRAEAAEASLAEIREAVATFIKVNGEHARAGYLAEALGQILDREPLGKSSSEGEA